MDKMEDFINKREREILAQAFGDTSSFDSRWSVVKNWTGDLLEFKNQFIKSCERIASLVSALILKPQVKNLSCSMSVFPNISFHYCDEDFSIRIENPNSGSFRVHRLNRHGFYSKELLNPEEVLSYMDTVYERKAVDKGFVRAHRVIQTPRNHV